MLHFHMFISTQISIKRSIQPLDRNQFIYLTLDQQLYYESYPKKCLIQINTTMVKESDKKPTKVKKDANLERKNLSILVIYNPFTPTLKI